MSKKENSNGKGDRNRITNKKKFDKNWEKIFGNTKSRYEQYDFRPDEHDAHYE